MAKLQRTLNPPARPSNFSIFALLAVAVFAVYSQSLRFDFVSYDDPDYVTANPHVQAGFTASGVAWALGSGFAGNWFPLTWISHMLDCALFGLDAGAHHFTNVCIHVLTTLLCFAWLLRLTGARWRSALVAFLFALHPLHVESVAWVSERKDVLSGLFFILTLWAYTNGRRGVSLGLFCCGLMAKPMLVTVPLLLLLLDQWPLRRGWKLAEKIPFFAASLAVSVITWIVHRQAGAAAPLALIPLALRVENALVSYLVYILQMLWPVKLAVFYPYPLSSLVVPAVLAAIAISLITIRAIHLFPRFPYLAFGWLWYLTMLLPVIGIVQVGAQARADRYTYLPMLGLSIAVVWGAAEVFRRRPRPLAALAAAVCLACAFLTARQASYWHDSVTLYQHAIAATEGNYVARYNLAAVYEARGQLDEAAAQLRETVLVRPLFAPAHGALGQVLAKQGRPSEALPELRAALGLRTPLAEDHLRLASVLGALGRNDEAAGEFAECLRLDPANPDAHYNYGISLAQSGRIAEAEREFRATLASRPSDIEARFNLAIALSTLGRREDAIAELNEVLRLKSDFTPARQELDSLLHSR